MGWKFISSVTWNHRLDLVTYHRIFKDGTILEIDYLFPTGKKRMDDYQERVYSRRKIGKKGQWKEGRLKRGV